LDANQIGIVVNRGGRRIQPTVNKSSSSVITGYQEWRPRVIAERADESEEALLLAARRGDDGALERLFARSERTLYLLCRSIVGQAEDAEDAVQETFLRALHAFPRFRGESQVHTWLTRIAVNVCLTLRRGRRARPETLAPDPQSEPQSPSHEAEVLMRLTALEALASLPIRGRAVLLLKEREGWSTAEIARATRCTERQVYYELQKAYRALADWRAAHSEDCER
jgi:RNA polymerase sigma-70 factor (ECF subfamily)